VKITQQPCLKNDPNEAKFSKMDIDSSWIFNCRQIFDFFAFLVIVGQLDFQDLLSEKRTSLLS
jgi:hypothetical protein